MGIHIRIWETLTFRVRRVFHPQQTNLFDKPKGAPGEPTEEEKNRIEPNRTEEPKADRADSRKTTTKQPDVFSQTDGTEKPNWTELEKENSARSVRRSAQCAVRQTNRQADEQTNGRAEGMGRGGGRTERDPARSPGHGAPASHFYAVHSACSAEGEQSPISKYECI